MTIKKLIKQMEDITEGLFVVYTNTDDCFNFLKDNQVLLAGEDDKEMFVIDITKIK
jgi:hypothetical protein